MMVWLRCPENVGNVTETFPFKRAPLGQVLASMREETLRPGTMALSLVLPLQNKVPVTLGLLSQLLESLRQEDHKF